ncbi:MAG: hypothetical protein AB7P17_04850 [Nitrospirales bacterium]|nr:hypothetical protein [Nitrospirales bacterium]
MMQGFKKSTFMTVQRATRSAAILGCVLFLSAQPGFAESLNGSDREVGAIVEHKQVEKTITGSYHYESNYEMTKDQNGNYHSTYQSEKKEWFCCFHLFSSEKAVSTKSENP